MSHRRRGGVDDGDGDVSPQELLRWLNVHEAMELPEHNVVFPWLHSYSRSVPPVYPDAVAVLRSRRLYGGAPHWLPDSGVIVNSLDPGDYLISWTDQIKFDVLRDPDLTGDNDAQELHEIVESVLLQDGFNRQVILPNGTVLDSIVGYCVENRVLPFLKTDPEAWQKYCNKNYYSSVSNSVLQGQGGSRTANSIRTVQQSHNFRRFDLQPAKMVELAFKSVVYCLNLPPGSTAPQSHNAATCCSCSALQQVLDVALLFIQKCYTDANQARDLPHRELLTLAFTNLAQDFPAEIFGTPPLTTESMNRVSPIQLATQSDVMAFNNWDSDLHFHEKLEMQKMSSMTLVDENHRLWCGNLTDYQVYRLFQKNGYAPNDNTDTKPLYYEPGSSVATLGRIHYDKNHFEETDSQLFNRELPMQEPLKVIIHCSDRATFPNVKRLWRELEETLRESQDTTFALSYPCSGSLALGNLNISSIESILNTCYALYQISKLTPLSTLLYCTDGYTETTLLLVTYLIFLWDLSLEDVIFQLHKERERPFYLFQVDLQILGHLQTLLRNFSPKRTHNRTVYDSAAAHGGPMPPLAISAEMFSEVFLMKLPDSLTDFNKLNGPLPSRILPHLYLGSLEHAHNPEMLRRLGVTHIVSVGENLSWVSANRTTRHMGVVRHRGISSPPPPPTQQAIPHGILSLRESSRRRLTLSQEPGPGEGDSAGLFSVFEQDGFQICKIDNLEDNGRDLLTGQGQLDRTLEFIDRGVLAGGKVFVHCMVGVSRSATVCIAECMKRLQVDLLRAYLYVRVRRLNIIIQPNLMFMYELLKWQETSPGVVRRTDWHVLCRAIAELNRKYIR
ncbi:tyrosine/serine/threonine protein phosphatase PPS1 KNAG_0C01720 [Huiozyma naganishii CBS 8797]|uniref:Uncharacterized protein n=1 Tax=Huiozyma naganishii (strain ATCC MYA-139 / BCRC 22969 / CBS 8797 / KCTC 17520 / NBRC 10181 / NCYC 3082 / Yp74L-3) TaxID=1071383 RepID=J7S5P7_HUIN7|nr:hypothetical protein KNAG_0C01720 [Kazachstania naganishii CBS 8797]CCK69286.1 hypothetical protein KNAG_0C01720 [Kazachstania naganishii CBS 8797]